MAGIAVVALGGNVLLAEGQRGTYEEQSANAAAMARPIRALLADGWRVVVVHGNGPQVGNLAIQQEMGRAEVPEMPLFSLGAMTEGQLGSLVAIALFRACGSSQPIAALLSHVIVDLDDPAFDRPTKPIGPFLTEDVAREMEENRGWQFVEDSGRGFRRVVASPEPKGFVEIEAIRSLLEAGPARRHRRRRRHSGGTPAEELWDGVDAVVDKDYGAAELAHQLRAEALLMITGVDAVQLDFGQATQSRLTWMSAADAQRHLADGQFPPGSMGPKVRAALQFVCGGGRTAVITSPQLVAATLGSDDPDDETVGTRIVPDEPRQDCRR